MIIIYPHIPQIKSNMVQTRDFIDSLSNEFEIFEIVTPENDKLAYHDGLKKIWGKDDIIIIEQDVLPTKKFIKNLIECNHKNCGAPVLLCESHTGLPRKIRMILDIVMTDDGLNVARWAELPWGTEYANSLGLACVKISKQIQLDTMHRFLNSEFYYPRIDEGIVRLLNTKFHVHYEETVEHNCV